MRTRSEALSLAGLRRMERSVKAPGRPSILDVAEIVTHGIGAFLPYLEHGQKRFFELLKESRRGLHVPPTVRGDLPDPSRPVVRPDGKPVHAVLLGALDAERLAGEVEVPLARDAEEGDRLEQVRVGPQGVPVTNEVARDG